MRYVHKPTVVDAQQYNGVGSISQKFFEALCKAPCTLGGDRYQNGFRLPHIDTLHGPVQLELGWWIVRELDGSGFYPVAPHVFAASYEPAEVTA